MKLFKAKLADGIDARASRMMQSDLKSFAASNDMLAGETAGKDGAEHRQQSHLALGKARAGISSTFEQVSRKAKGLHNKHD